MRSVGQLRQIPALCWAFAAAAHSLLCAACRSASIFNLNPQHFAFSVQLLDRLL